MIKTTINGFIIFCLLITFAYFIGLLTFFGENEKDKCDMTYMFEVPQYVRISNNYDKLYPKYGLYYYDEGPPYKNTPKFWGIPVLFIPGNAGSHKQGRSLASIALRKSINKRLPYHFDYFVIDTNEELTGLSGIYLNDQLDYVNRSLYFILNLYKNQRYPPKSVVLIGHSMGGVIARKLAQFNNSPIEIVITLASPHKRSPIILDEYISEFYKTVDIPIRSNITFINLSGGYSDLLVPTTLTDSKDNNSLYVITTHIPLCWSSSDHKQILWCKQCILVLTRCLFDCIDTRYRQISDSSEFRKKIFEHHLIRHSGINAKQYERYSLKTDFEEDAEWIERLPRQYSIRVLKGNKKLQWYMIRLTNDPKHEILTIIGINIKFIDWIYACNAHIPHKNYKICNTGIHLTHLTSIEPSARYKRRSITINLHELKKNYTNELINYVLFKIPIIQEPLVYHVDVYNKNERNFNFKLPNWWDYFKKIIIKETIENSINYQICLNDLTHVIQSFYVKLKPIKCLNEVHHSTVSLIVPWGNENFNKHFTDLDKDEFHIRLYNSKPNNTNDTAYLKLTLDPTCRYELSIRRSLKGTLSQLARFYTPLLIVNVSTVILLILKTQLQALGKGDDCTSFFEALKSGTKPYYVLGSAKIGTALLTSGFFGKIGILPMSNWYLLKEEGVDFLLLPYVMYLISVGIIWIFASLITIWITLCESTIHKYFLKFLTKTVPFAIVWSDYMLSALQKIPCLVSISIIFISFNTCGGLALALGTIFYFLKLTQMSQDYIEETVFTFIKKLIKKYRKKEQNNDDNSNEIKLSPPSAISFHGTLFLIWVLATIINAPSIVTWARNYKYNKILNPDPSFLPGFVLSLCTLPLWYLDIPNTKKIWYNQVSYIINTIAVISLIYAPIYIFRLNFMLSAVVVVIVIHQLLAPVTTELSITNNISEIDEDLIKYENIKKKLE